MPTSVATQKWIKRLQPKARYGLAGTTDGMTASDWITLPRW
jgi:hypothetical protein